jgi:hypothetical protein
MVRILMVLAFLLGSAAIAQNTWTVPVTHRTIDAALQAAQRGDTILIEPGTYYETGLSFGGKALILRGTGGADVTIIDGQQMGRILDLTQDEGPTTLIEGLTFRNGRAPNGSVLAPAGKGEDGGAIRCIGSSPTIVGCRFEGNAAGSGFVAPFMIAPSGEGGALSIQDGQLLLVDCTFSDNAAGGGRAGGNGGAVAVLDSSVVARRCRFLHNETGISACPSPRQSGSGGACHIEGGSGLFEDCLFQGNRTSRGAMCGGLDKAGRGGSGGALSGFLATGLIVDRCRFLDNVCGDGGAGKPSEIGGGGGAIKAAAAIVTSSLFVGNRAGDGYSQYSPFMSEGGGSILVDDGWIIGCTITESYRGSSISAGAVQTTERINTPLGTPIIPRLFIINSILWDNDFSFPPEPWRYPLSVETSIVEGWYPGAGNLAIDPLFVDSVVRNFRLRGASPGLDSADRLQPLNGLLDVDGIPRVQGAGLDRGCYERPCRPGTSFPFVGRVSINGTPHTGPCDVSVAPLDTVEVVFAGIDGAYVGSSVLFAANRFPHGQPPVPTTLPGLHLDLSSVSFGEGLLTSDGIRLTLDHGPPHSLAGATVRIQAIVLDAQSFEDGDYILSPALDLVFL